MRDSRTVRLDSGLADRLRVEADDVGNAGKRRGIMFQHEWIVAGDDMAGRAREPRHRVESLQHVSDAFEDRERPPSMKFA